MAGSVLFSHVLFWLATSLVLGLDKGTPVNADPAQRIDSGADNLLSHSVTECNYDRLEQGRFDVAWSSAAVRLIASDNTSATTQQLCELACCQVAACNMAALTANVACLLLQCSNMDSCTERRMEAGGTHSLSPLISFVVGRQQSSVSPQNHSEFARKTALNAFNQHQRHLGLKNANKAADSATGGASVGSISALNATTTPSAATQTTTLSAKHSQNTSTTPTLAHTSAGVSLMCLTSGDCGPRQTCVPFAAHRSLAMCRCNRPRYTLLPSLGENINCSAVMANAGYVAFNTSQSARSGVVDLCQCRNVSQADPVSYGCLSVSVTNHTLVLPQASVNLTAAVLNTHPLYQSGVAYQYMWRELSTSSPSSTSPEESGVVADESPRLVLHALTRGRHVFRLHVYSSAGQYATCVAHVIVLPAVVAMVTPASQSLRLPLASVLLDGSGSVAASGDRPLRYSWQLEHAPVEYQQAGGGLSKLTPDGATMRLEQPVVGNYTVRLTVEDDNGASNSSLAEIVLLSELSSPAIVSAGPNVTIQLPRSWAILDGSNSSVPAHDTEWNWTQISGPSNAVLVNSTNSRANATALTQGSYVFRLSVVSGDAAVNSDTMSVTVQPMLNMAPVADAGGNVSVRLPLALVTLNGTRSHDDEAVLRWHWRRLADSPAAGDIVPHTDTSSVLQLVNVAVGRYRFTLDVYDGHGAVGSDTVVLSVMPDSDAATRVLLQLNVPYAQLKSWQRDCLSGHLAELLSPYHPHKSAVGTEDTDGAVSVRIDRWSEHPDSLHLVVVFSASVLVQSHTQSIPAQWIVSTLEQRLSVASLQQSSEQRPEEGHQCHTLLTSSRVVRLVTLQCQNDCSGHGQCDPATRQCRCRTFWIADPIRLFLTDRRANCDWSLLYVVLISFSVVMATCALCWWLALLWQRRRQCGAVAASGSGGSGAGGRALYSPLTHTECVRMSHKGALSSMFDSRSVDSDSSLDGNESEDTRILFHKSSTTNSSSVAPASKTGGASVAMNRPSKMFSSLSTSTSAGNKKRKRRLPTRHKGDKNV